jgi:hypothetical protein
MLEVCVWGLKVASDVSMVAATRIAFTSLIIWLRKVEEDEKEEMHG